MTVEPARLTGVPMGDSSVQLLTSCTSAGTMSSSKRTEIWSFSAPSTAVPETAIAEGAETSVEGKPAGPKADGS